MQVLRQPSSVSQHLHAAEGETLASHKAPMDGRGAAEEEEEEEEQQQGQQEMDRGVDSKPIAAEALLPPQPPREEEEEGYGLIGVAMPVSKASCPPSPSSSPAAPTGTAPAPAPASPPSLRRRGSNGVLLSGLVRLLPLGMMPRTSLRYKRHLSCADVDAFQVCIGM